MQPKRSIKVIPLLCKLAIAYLVVLIPMTIFQRELMYFPWDSGSSPREVGLALTREVPLTAEDGTKLTAWYRPSPKGMPLIVYFHGNGGDISLRTSKLQALSDKGFGYLALSYRGYGKSEGTPTQDGLYMDAEAAIRFATTTLSVPSGRLIMYGESLGTGIATEMARRHPTAMLVLEAPYTSVVDRAAEIYWWAPVRWLIRDRYPLLESLNRVREPFLIFHGEKDTVIPIAHGKAVYEAANQPKQAYFLPEFGHDNIDETLIAQAVYDFATAQKLVFSPTTQK